MTADDKASNRQVEMNAKKRRVLKDVIFVDISTVVAISMLDGEVKESKLS